MKKFIPCLVIFSFLVACQQTEVIATPTSTLPLLATQTATITSTLTPTPRPTYFLTPTRVPTIFDTAYSTERGVMIFTFHYQGDRNDYNAFHVFISSYKPDKITGYKIQTIDADYMLENGKLYQYSGSGEDWNWKLVELPVLHQNEDNFVTWKIYEDTYLGTWNEFTYVFQVVDKNWNTEFTTNVFSVMYTH